LMPASSLKSEQNKKSLQRMIYEKCSSMRKVIQTKRWASKMSIVKCSQNWTNLICCAREATELVTAGLEATSNVVKISTVLASFAKLRMKSFQNILMYSPDKCSMQRKRRRRSIPRRCFLKRIRIQLLQPPTLRMTKKNRNNSLKLFNLKNLLLTRSMKLRMRTMFLAKTRILN